MTQRKKEAEKKPLDLKEYFKDEEQFLFVRRKELKEILGYLVDKGTLTQALVAFDDAIRAEIKKEVQAEMGAFMLAQQGKGRTEGGLIVVP